MNKTIDSSYTLLTKPVELKDYFKSVCVWEEDSVESAIMEALDLTRDDYGICLVFFDKYEDIMLMPTHKYSYKVEGKEVSYEEACIAQDNDVEVDLINEVTHNVGWTETLGVHESFRLEFIYTGCKYTKEQVESYIQQYEDLLNKHEKSMSHINKGE